MTETCCLVKKPRNMFLFKEENGNAHITDTYYAVRFAQPHERATLCDNKGRPLEGHQRQ